MNLKFGIKHWLFLYSLVLSLTSCVSEINFEIEDAKKNNSIDELEFLLEKYFDDNQITKKIKIAIKETEKKIDEVEYESFIDPRDGNSYKTILLRDGRIWMAENMQYDNIKLEGTTWCPNEIQDNCKKYGRLYTWESAKNACPVGWHLPSDEELWNMISKYGGSDQARIISSAPIKENPTNSKDAYWALMKSKFNIQLGGKRRKKLFSKKFHFYKVGIIGLYWTNNKLPNDEIIYYFISSTTGTIMQSTIQLDWEHGYSCRCIKNKNG